MESHSAHPFGLAAFTSGAGLYSESEMLLLGGHKPLGVHGPWVKTPFRSQRPVKGMSRQFMAWFPI